MSEYVMTHTGKELDDAINKVKSGYVLPTETINIDKNTTSPMDITNGKWLNVNVQIPEGYINLANVINHCTQVKAGTFNPASDVTLAKTSIATIGFKPKIFVLFSTTSISVSSTSGTDSRYYINSTWFVTDDKYVQNSYQTDNGTAVTARRSLGVYGVSNTARSVSSNSVNNTFSSDANGVTGSGYSGANMYFKANASYQWLAWG